MFEQQRRNHVHELVISIGHHFSKRAISVVPISRMPWSFHRISRITRNGLNDKNGYPIPNFVFSNMRTNCFLLSFSAIGTSNQPLRAQSTFDRSRFFVSEHSRFREIIQFIHPRSVRITLYRTTDQSHSQWSCSQLRLWCGKIIRISQHIHDDRYFDEWNSLSTKSQ